MGAEDDGAAVLQKWAQEKRLSSTKLSGDGSSLTLDGTTLDASKVYAVSHEAKTCKYTLSSMYLQILDPNQGLMAYRGACKKHGVKGPVKALDKPVVVGFFLGGEAGEEQEAAVPAVQAAAPVAEEEPPKPKRKDEERRKSRDKDDHRKRKDHHREEKRHREKESSKDKKKRKGTPMTNEQLFSNLNVVVDKRMDTSKEAEEVQAALSAAGFMVSQEELKKDKDVTETIQTMEIPVGNSASILRAAAAAEGRDFSRVLELYLETIKPKKPDKKQDGKKGQQRGGKEFLVGKKPVIILPKGMQPPLTMLNGYEFFAKSTYVPREVQLKKGRGLNNPTTFTRKISPRLGGGEVEYELMDNPKAKLGDNPKEWERVVAVVALGAAWQFKDWPGRYCEPVHLFMRSFGFFVGMEGDIPPPDVAKWNVKSAMLNRDKRGLDSVSSAVFWNGLDEWMSVHKPELLPKKET